MTPLQIAVNDLLKIANKRKVSFVLAQLSEQDNQALNTALDLSQELQEFYKNFNPSPFAIWHLGGWFKLFGYPKLLEMRKTYDRQVIPFGHDAWPARWLGIGEISGDILVADMNRPGTPILYFPHDKRVAAKEIFPSFVDLIRFLKVWIEIFHGQYHEEAFDWKYRLKKNFLSDLFAKCTFLPESSIAEIRAMIER